jgi:hypothetical protein
MPLVTNTWEGDSIKTQSQTAVISRQRKWRFEELKEKSMTEKRAGAKGVHVQDRIAINKKKIVCRVSNAPIAHLRCFNAIRGGSFVKP